MPTLMTGGAAPENPWADRRALLALAPLALACLVVIAWCPWYSNLGPDTITEFEQIRNVADHGTLAWDNGPVADFPELRTRWFIHRHGRAYGILPPLMAYVYALPMKLGGFRGTVRALWLTLLAGALLTYALTYRLTRRPPLAVASAYALLLGTTIAYWCTATLQFIPASTFGFASVYLGARAFDAPTRRRALAHAAASGLLGGLALGCHLIWTAPLAFVGAVFALEGRWRERVERCVAYGAGALPPLVAIGVINHDRFGSWSPVSYGPCTSSTCTPDTTANTQSASAFAETLLPVMPYVLVFAVGLWLVRRSTAWTALLAIVGACAALLPDTETQHRFWLLARATWGYVVDLGSINMGFPRAPGGVGSWSGRDGSFSMRDAGQQVMAVRALLQCSPFLAAALLARLPARTDARAVRDRAAILMCAAAALGAVLILTARANLQGADIYGWPILNSRYVTVTFMPATVLACVGLAHLPLRAWHAALALALGGAAAAVLAQTPSDEDLLRRQLTHWLPLALAFLAWVLPAAARLHRGRGAYGRVAALAVALAAGYGVASTFGIDWPTSVRWRAIQDRHTHELARCAPQRFILLGGYATDEAMALHDRRDIMLINVGMGPRDGSGARTLLDRYMRPDRPAFLLQDDEHGPWHFQWPGYEFRPCPTSRLVYQIVRTGAP